MLTNFNQSPVTDDEVIDQDPEIDNEREEQISANTSYSYVDPELCQRWYQETQQETPLDRKLLAILEFIDRLEERDKEIYWNKWLNHWKRKCLFLVIIPALVAGLLSWLRK